MGPTLARFRGYWFTACDMELQKRKRMADLMRPEGDPRRARTLYCMARQEEILDRGYADLEAVGEAVGDRAAEVIGAHFLEGEDWHDLSARLGIPYDKCKKIAYNAFRRCDAMNEERPQGV